MNKIFLIISILIGFGYINQIKAQDTDSCNWEYKANVDLFSRYVWRGVDFGNSPSIQPTMKFVYKEKLEFGLWGAFATNDPYQEVDLFCKYSFSKNRFSLLATDYYILPNATFNQNYFDFGKSTTAHTLELTASFNGVEKFPLTFSLNTMLYGADRIFSDSSKNTTTNLYEYNFKSAYSTYLELAYTFKTKKGDLNVFGGYNVNGVDIEDVLFVGGEGFYFDGPGLTNLGVKLSKTIEINNFSLPITTQFSLNPKRERVYFTVGVSL